MSPGWVCQEMYNLASEVPHFAQGGIGAYDTNFLHVDVRDHRALGSRVGEIFGIQELVREPNLIASTNGESRTPA